MLRLFTLFFCFTLLLVPEVAVRGASFVYVSDAPNQAIKVYKMNEADGALSPVESLAVAGGPGALGVDPQRKFLFASLRSANTVASYRIDPATGKLALIGDARLEPGANAAYVTTDRHGKFLLTASYSGGRVVTFALDAQGRIGPEPLQTVMTAKTAHSVGVTADDRLVLVPHVAPNAVYQFRFDPTTGRLTELGQAPGGAEKAGPRHIAIHPSQKFAFTSDESGSSVTLYALDAAAGLKPLKTLSTLPADFTARNSTAEVKLHPSGKFVWVSNRGHDSLAGFRFDAADASLAPLGQTPTEKTPRSFDVEPSGRFLFAAGEGTGKLAAYAIDATSGKLTRTATYDVGKSLTWVMAVRLP